MGRDSVSLLLVCDLPTRGVLRPFLEKEGCVVRETSSGREGLSMAHSSPPHVVLADDTLPDTDGRLLCSKLRELSSGSSTIIFLLSEKKSLEAEIRGLESGADDFLVKPIQLAELGARLNARIRRLLVQREKEEMLEKLAEKMALMNIRLRQEATTDGLTGLYNQRYFWKNLESEFVRAKRLSRPLSLILIDLDHFKGINDRYGHAMGDSVLREVGKLLKSQLRGIDLVARSGGEEFGVILPETHLQNAVFIAQRLRMKCTRFRISSLPQEEITLSAGLAAFPQHATTPMDLYKKVDEALYQAKAQGRNRVVAA